MSDPRSLVSVVLPFHRVDRLLEEALRSVQGQSLRTTVILVDDRRASLRTPLPRGWVRASDELLSTEMGQEGYGAALAIGSTRVDTEFLALMNSDDRSMPDRLRAQLSRIGDADLCAAGMRKTYRGRELPWILGDPDLNRYHFLLLLLGPYAADATWFMRTEWWRKHAFFDAAPSLDWRIALRSFDSSSIATTPEKLYEYRQNPEQVTRTGRNQGVMLSAFQDWEALSSSVGLPIMSRASASLIGTAWETPADRANLDEVFVWVREFRQLARNQGLAPQVDDMLKRRLAVAAIRGGLSPMDRIRALGKGRDALGKMALESMRTRALRARA